MSEATGCQNAFVSQVLNGEVNFNLEQGIKISEFLKLHKDEKEYFLWMVELKRAGTQDLKKYFQSLMSALREKNLLVNQRVQIPQILSSEAQNIYYGSSIYSSVHIAVMIPELNTIAKISKAFELPESKIEEVVNFLAEHGLLEIEGAKIKSGKIQIHLKNDSSNINKHHTNWRIEAIKSLDRPSVSDLHYSGVSSLSYGDSEKIKLMFVELIEKYVRKIETSNEETLFAFNLDYFKILKS